MRITEIKVDFHSDCLDNRTVIFRSDVEVISIYVKPLEQSPIFQKVMTLPKFVRVYISLNLCCDDFDFDYVDRTVQVSEACFCTHILFDHFYFTGSYCLRCESFPVAHQTLTVAERLCVVTLTQACPSDVT